MPVLPRTVKQLVERDARKLFALDAEEPFGWWHILDRWECVATTRHRN